MAMFLSFIDFDVPPSLVQTTSVISNMLDNSFQQQGTQYFNFFTLHPNFWKQCTQPSLQVRLPKCAPHREGLCSSIG